MFDKKSLLQKLEQMNLDWTQYWLITGGAMVLYGAKEQTADIDLGCTSQLADQLQQKGCAVERMPDGTRRIVYDEQVEIFENWLEDQVVLWEGVPVISRKGLVFMKRKLGRSWGGRRISVTSRCCGRHSRRKIWIARAGRYLAAPARGRTHILPSVVLILFALGRKAVPKVWCSPKDFPAGSWFSRCR